jgi:hypothetical protein
MGINLLDLLNIRNKNDVKISAFCLEKTPSQSEAGSICGHDDGNTPSLALSSWEG